MLRISARSNSARSRLPLRHPGGAVALPGPGQHLGNADLFPRHILLAQGPVAGRDVRKGEPQLRIVQRPRAHRLVALHLDPRDIDPREGFFDKAESM
jgi:hypothetical protein